MFLGAWILTLIDWWHWKTSSLNFNLSLFSKSACGAYFELHTWSVTWCGVLLESISAFGIRFNSVFTAAEIAPGVRAPPGVNGCVAVESGWWPDSSPWVIWFELDGWESVGIEFDEETLISIYTFFRNTQDNNLRRNFRVDVVLTASYNLQVCRNQASPSHLFAFVFF